MKVAIVNITTKGLSGGYQKYLSNILPRMAKNSSISYIKCFYSHQIIDSFHEPISKIDFIKVPNYHLYNKDFKLKVYNALSEYKPDVVYIPVEKIFNYQQTCVVNMLQNMEPFICPFEGNPFKEKAKNLLRYIVGRMAIKRANRVIAISDFVRDYMINKLGIDPSKIGLVYHGIEASKSVGIKPKVVNDDLKDFLFTAGSIRPARGLEDIILALGILSNKGYKIPLVIAGGIEKVMFSYKEKLDRLAKESGLGDLVYWVGHLNEEEMAWCFLNCRAFIMSSRVESFGLTGGEAMANGAICISADNPCLPELFQDSAVYYPPRDYKALADRIIEVLSWDENKRKQMSEKARKRAAEFSWDVCAEKTIAELKKAMEDYNSINRKNNG